MPNTALNRTTQVLLTNKSGGALTYGAVVILDNTNTNGFTTTTTSGLSTRGLGVILEPAGIANNASGMVAVGGWCPQVNLNTAAAIGQFIKTHTVAGQGTPHASPQVEGDFAVALSASATPPCNLFGSPNGPLAGGSGTVTATGTLTANKAIIGNGTTDITVSAASGVAHLASGTLTGSNVLLASEVTGVLPGTQGGGLVLVEQHTASSSASLDFTTAISSSYDNYLIQFVNIVPATTTVQLLMRMSTNGGSSYDSGTNYSREFLGWSAGGSSTGGGTGQTAMGLHFTTQLNTSASWGLVGSVYLYSPGSATLFKQIVGKTHFIDNANARQTTEVGGAYESATAVNAFQFLMSSGNIASGTIRVYGLAK